VDWIHLAQNRNLVVAGRPAMNTIMKVGVRQEGENCSSG
jgi:hypothetical protein